jgi:hypothetical protein
MDNKFHRSARPLTAKEAKARADAQFKARQERKADAPVATREYRDAQKAALARMAQLRAERLAREAAG